MNYSVGITTFESRFNTHFKKLVHQIKSQRPDLEILVYVNSQLGKRLNDDYRKDLLNFISQYKNIYPIVSPHFKCLSKMWNTIIVNSTSDKIFLFNDDIDILPDFFNQVEKVLVHNTSFRINGSFSHFLVERSQVFEVGFFDERLIGIGEEDGDWCFRWERKYQRHLPIFSTNLIFRYNGWSSDIKGTPWNADWIFKNKYDPDHTQLALTQGFPGNGNGGMYGKPVAIRKESIELDFYPSEKFYWDHIDELDENFGKK